MEKLTTRFFPILKVPPYGILFSNKKKWTTNICNNIDGSQCIYTKRKKLDSWGYILCDAIDKTFLTKQNYSTIGRKTDHHSPGPGCGRKGTDYKGEGGNFCRWGGRVTSWLWQLHDCMCLSKLTLKRENFTIANYSSVNLTLKKKRIVKKSTWVCYPASIVIFSLNSNCISMGIELFSGKMKFY